MSKWGLEFFLLATIILHSNICETPTKMKGKKGIVSGWGALASPYLSEEMMTWCLHELSLISVNVSFA